MDYRYAYIYIHIYQTFEIRNDRTCLKPLANEAVVNQTGHD